MRIFLVIASGLVLLISCGESPAPEDSDSFRDGEIVSGIADVTDTAVLEDTLLMSSENEEIINAEGPDGAWNTTMGVMEFSTDNQGYVNGVYPLGTINGELDGIILEFTYSEGSLEGTGSFIFNEEFSSFQGIQDIAGTELIWNGQRM